MTSLEFYRGVAPAFALIRNGHTQLSASGETWSALALRKLLPLGVRVIDGRAFVLRDFSGEPSLEGWEIQSINGRSSRDIIAQINRSSLLDGVIPSALDRNNSGWGLIYNLSLIAGIEAPYEILLRQSGATRRVEMEGLTTKQLTEAWKQFPNDREASPERKAALRFDGHVAVLTIPHWDYVEEGKRSMIDDIGDWFAEIQKRRPKSLIIDIRSNSGGDETVATSLFQRLTERPFVQYRCIGVNARDFSFLRLVKEADEYRRNLSDYTLPASASCRWLAPFELTKRPNIGVQRPVTPTFPGKLIVLTDGGSFSTSAEFAAMVRSRGRGTIIGEETSGSYYGSDSGIMVPLVLPNSKLELSIPTISYWLDVRRDVARDRGVQPDIRARETIGDMIAGNDRVMAVAMREAR